MTIISFTSYTIIKTVIICCAYCIFIEIISDFHNFSPTKEKVRLQHEEIIMQLNQRMAEKAGYVENYISILVYNLYKIFFINVKYH